MISVDTKENMRRASARRHIIESDEALSAVRSGSEVDFQKISPNASRRTSDSIGRKRKAKITDILFDKVPADNTKGYRWELVRDNDTLMARIAVLKAMGVHAPAISNVDPTTTRTDIQIRSFKTPFVILPLGNVSDEIADIPAGAAVGLGRNAERLKALKKNLGDAFSSFSMQLQENGLSPKIAEKLRNVPLPENPHTRIRLYSDARKILESGAVHASLSRLLPASRTSRHTEDSDSFLQIFERSSLEDKMELLFISYSPYPIEQAGTDINSLRKKKLTESVRKLTGKGNDVLGYENMSELLAMSDSVLNSAEASDDGKNKLAEAKKRLAGLFRDLERKESEKLMENPSEYWHSCDAWQAMLRKSIFENSAAELLDADENSKFNDAIHSFKGNQTVDYDVFLEYGAKIGGRSTQEILDMDSHEEKALDPEDRLVKAEELFLKMMGIDTMYNSPSDTIIPEAEDYDPVLTAMMESDGSNSLTYNGDSVFLMDTPDGTIPEELSVGFDDQDSKFMPDLMEDGRPLVTPRQRLDMELENSYRDLPYKISVEGLKQGMQRAGAIDSAARDIENGNMRRSSARKNLPLDIQVGTDLNDDPIIYHVPEEVFAREWNHITEGLFRNTGIYISAWEAQKSLHHALSLNNPETLMEGRKAISTLREKLIPVVPEAKASIEQAEKLLGNRPEIEPEKAINEAMAAIRADVFKARAAIPADAWEKLEAMGVERNAAERMQDSISEIIKHQGDEFDASMYFSVPSELISSTDTLASDFIRASNESRVFMPVARVPIGGDVLTDENGSFKGVDWKRFEYVWSNETADRYMKELKSAFVDHPDFVKAVDSLIKDDMRKTTRQPIYIPKDLSREERTALIAKACGNFEFLPKTVKKSYDSMHGLFNHVPADTMKKLRPEDVSRLPVHNGSIDSKELSSIVKSRNPRDSKNQKSLTD